jgi:hypothetical protein
MVSEGMVARAGAGVWMLSDSIHQQGIAIDYVQTVDHWDGEQWCSVRTSNDTTRMLSELWVSPSGQVWGAGYALVRVL